MGRPSKRDRLVALIGVDGSGKTTLAEGLKEALQARGQRCTTVYMGRGKGRALPGGRSAAKALGVNLPSTQDVGRGKGVFYSLLRMGRDILFLLDAYVRYARSIVPGLRDGGYVVTDRYAYDIVLNDQAPRWTGWFLVHVYPMPGVVVYLTHDPEILHRRKPQYDTSFLNGQMGRLEAMVAAVEATGRARVVRITPETPEKTLTRTLQELL